ncbi:MAG: aldo/keto reductase [Hyphomicrobiales bacterium]|nr:MAG: aldo/keto reductase [Hyphomicrobiales bacterium]
MTTRKIGEFEVAAIGVGCMNLSHAYGTPPDAATGERFLNEALDMGYDFFDTATIYGSGKNETLVGKALKSRRDEYMLCSKGGMYIDDNGKRIISSRPDSLRKNVEDSLRRLQVDVIDLYYLHRLDRNTPIEESIGAMADMMKEGKIKGIGLSEVSAITLRKAYAEHPIAAIQSEYSLWTRNPEIAVLDACQDLGTAFVAFSPNARAFLTGKLAGLHELEDGDLRHRMPRFNAENYPKNLALLDKVKQVADSEGCTLAQLANAWVVQQSECIVSIPGTQNLEHLAENFSALKVTLSADALAKLDEIMAPSAIAGPRYTATVQLDIDTEEF